MQGRRIQWLIRTMSNHQSDPAYSERLSIPRLFDTIHTGGGKNAHPSDMGISHRSLETGGQLAQTTEWIENDELDELAKTTKGMMLRGRGNGRVA